LSSVLKIGITRPLWKSGSFIALSTIKKLINRISSGLLMNPEKIISTQKIISSPFAYPKVNNELLPWCANKALQPTPHTRRRG
jgi:hypothetical protein